MPKYSDRVKDVLTRTDEMVVQDIIDGGGYLLPEQMKKFVEYLTDTPTILGKTRQEILTHPKREIDKFGFRERALRTPGAMELTPLNSTDYAKPSFGKLEIDTVKKMAEVRFSYEFLEDNIEKAGFRTKLMRALAGRIALDIEEWLINADTAISGDTFLDDEDGYIKKAKNSGHVVDADGSTVDSNLFFAVERAIPARYFRWPGWFYLASQKIGLDWRQKLSERATNIGDQYLVNDTQAKMLGRNIVGCANIFEDETFTDTESTTHNDGTNILFCNPANLIWAIYRNVLIETDKDISSQEYKIVVSLRMGLQVDETDALGLITHVVPRPGESA